MSKKFAAHRLALLLVVSAGLSTLAVVGGVVAWRQAASSNPPAAQDPQVLELPTPPPQLMRPLSPEQALAANAELPFSKEPIEPARAFLLPEMGAANYEAALDCLTAAIYYEAASEAEQGQRAVAQVVLNRVRHPAFPNSVCNVVYQGSERTTGCQFTFTCDGSLGRKPSRGGWDRARKIATSALNGTVESTVGTATHYHTDWVMPYWASELDKIVSIKSHIFYRWRGNWGKRRAFTGYYAGETLPGSALSSLPLQIEDALSPSDHVITGSSLLDDLLGPLSDLSSRQLKEDEISGELMVDIPPRSLVVDQLKSDLEVDKGLGDAP